MPNPVLEEVIYIRHRAEIAGYVTDAITGKGILGVAVKVVGKRLQTLTREDGFFYFLDLEKGSYELEVLVPKESRSIYGGSDDKPTAKVLGVIVESDGKPVFDVKANVTLYPTRLVGSVKRSDNALSIPNAIVKLRGSEIQALTDQEGRYLLSGVPAGDYTIQVSAVGFEPPKPETVTLTAGSDTKKDFSLSMISTPHG